MDYAVCMGGLKAYTFYSEHLKERYCLEDNATSDGLKWTR
jgi:hypothetical protein